MIEGPCHCKAVKWTCDFIPESITACNCTVCSRYGVLWAYGHLNENIKVDGETQVYTRGEKNIGFHFCSNCGCVAYWLALHKNQFERKRIVVNVRLMTSSQLIMDLPIDHFDGLDKFEDLPQDGRCVKDMWF